MRVHRLELTAFGPFAGTETIDFDPLNDAGIFLLTGQTGAGKTSILDAICFGLFGAVPGARNSAKDLKSHHAEPATVPAVKLEVTVRGRRFKLRRSPAWQRPSRRARAGYVDENAQARASELVDGDWRHLSNRVDEVGHLITRILGMSKDQFCQVVMLPQGHFETFLRAGAKERHDVLESLFETGRFQRVEKWLTQQRRAREDDCLRHEAALDQLLARIEEANDAALPDPPDGATTFESKQRVLAGVVQSLTSGLFDARLSEHESAHRVKTARHAHAQAQVLAERRERYAVATRNLTALDATADLVAERAQRIHRARAAADLVPLLDLLDEADVRHSAAVHEIGRCRGLISGWELRPGGASELDDAETETETMQRRRAELETLVDLGAGADSMATRVTELEHERAEVRTHLETVTAKLHHLPQQVEEVHAGRDAAARACADVEGLQRRMDVAHASLAASVEAAGLAAEIARAEDSVRRAHDRYLQVKQVWLELRVRHVAGIAAVLAQRLSPGVDCPVCGSVEHPHPAAPADDHVSALDEAAALDDSTAAELYLRDQQSELQTLRSRHAGAAARAAGQDVAEAQVRRDEADRTLLSAGQARVDYDELSARAQELADIEQEWQRQRGTLMTRDAVIGSEITQATTSLRRLRDRLDQVVGPGGSVEARLAETASTLRSLQALAEAIRRAATLAHDRGQRATRVHDALASSEFAAADDVRAANLTRSEVAAAETLNRTYADQRAIEQAVLTDAQLVQAASLSSPDLAQLVAAAEALELDHASTTSAVRRTAERLSRLETLQHDLHTALEAWGPLRTARDVAVDVAAMCAGTSADNRTRTRLSHYVLSARLQQVVDAANLRLSSISAGRYQLRHSMDRGVGDARGGLSLLVLDSYTGQTRDPATLSGGETFYVSLALALGLADLVRDEIGGVELSTLFVDEGFGSLDADTLDEVMDEIDSLRSGGRCVGLVSHLTELRTRIPVRLEIVASPTGSRARPS